MLRFGKEISIFETCFNRKLYNDAAKFKIQSLQVQSSVAPLDCRPAKKHSLVLVMINLTFEIAFLCSLIAYRLCLFSFASFFYLIPSL